MKKFLTLSFGLASAAIAAPVYAAAVPTTPFGVEANSGPAFEQWQQSRLSLAKVAGNNERGGTPQANPLRAYPPSCASGTLPDKPPADAVSKDLVLLANKGGRPVAETAKVIVWRVPCSNSGTPTRYNPDGTASGMTLVRIERAAELADQYYYLPLISAAQGTIEFDKPASYPRIASEPNTRSADVLPGSGFNVSMTFVLENSVYPTAGYFLFNKAFKLRVDPRNAYIPSSQAVDLDIPAYAPAAGAPLPFDGYAAAQWTNATQNHGLILQVPEQYLGTDGAMTRQIIFDLLSKDLSGNPFWLVGGASFAVGATSVTADAYYLDKDLATKPWGKATFQLKHCNRLEVTFAPNAGLAAPVPSFDGTIAYDRLLNANGMFCE